MQNNRTRNESRIRTLTNFWLVTLAGIVGLTVACSALLVGWPLVAHLADKLIG